MPVQTLCQSDLVATSSHLSIAPSRSAAQGGTPEGQRADVSFSALSVNLEVRFCAARACAVRATRCQSKPCANPTSWRRDIVLRRRSPFVCCAGGGVGGSAHRRLVLGHRWEFRGAVLCSARVRRARDAMPVQNWSGSDLVATRYCSQTALALRVLRRRFGTFAGGTFVAAFRYFCRRMVYGSRLRKRRTPPSFHDQRQRLYCVLGSVGTSKLLLLHMSTNSFLQPFFCSVCGEGGVYSFGVLAYSMLFWHSVSDGRSSVRIGCAARSGFSLVVYARLLRLYCRTSSACI